MLMVISLIPLSDAFAQQKVRKYATRQGANSTLLASVNNPGNAVSGNPRNAADLSVGIPVAGLVYSEIILDFNPNPNSTSNSTVTYPSGTPVTIKLDLPRSLLGVGTAIVVQPITSLNRTGSGTIISPYEWNYTNVGTAVSGANLLALVSGSGTQELTITPNVAFQGVMIRLTGVLGLGLNTSVYHAYVMEDTPDDIACNDKIDVLSGVGSYLDGLENLATGIGTVSNPWNVIDGTTPNTRLSYLLAQVGSYVYHTTIFRAPSVVGDSVRMVLRQTGTIAEIGVLRNSLSIKTYNGNSAGTSIPGTNASLINIQLLASSTDQFEIKFAPTVVFDRVELQIGALLDLNILTQPVDLISIERIKPTPAIAGIGEGNNIFYQFVSQSTTLQATGAGSNTLTWYNAQVGGAAVSNTINPVTTDLIYWAQTSSAGCTEVSRRSPAYLYAVTDQSVVEPGTKNVVYTGNFIKANASSRDFTYSLSPTSEPLPNGLTLNSNGSITGIPTEIGTFPITVNIIDQKEVPNARTLGAMAISTGLTLDKSVQIGALPVTLAHFKATREGNITALNWATTEEVNSDRFEVLRSFDSKAWHTIGTVNANNNSAVENQYQFADANPANGNNYYRLKMIDRDGSFEMSLIESLTFDLGEEITISPNPAVDRIHIKTANLAGVEKIELRNSTGLVIYSAANASEIDVQRLPAGLYVLSITRTGGRVTSHKLLKQ